MKWNTERAEALDEIENAHAVVGGSERGRRYATQQINYSYVALLSSHFQGFCRDLHSECIERIVEIAPPQLRGMMSGSLELNRSLSRGNPHPGAIGSDFNRLGIDFWTAVRALDLRSERRRVLLQELIDWRNAIAHQDFDPVIPVGPPTLQLVRVRAWRRALDSLARDFDRVMYNHLSNLIGISPW
jgi:hypothetical protein